MKRQSECKRQHRALVTILMALGLTFTAAPTAEALTVPEARTYYLRTICAPNPAIDRLNWAIFRGQGTVKARQMHGKRLRQTRRALVNLARIEVVAARALVTPPSSWPTPESGQATRHVGQALIRDSQILLALRQRAGARFLRYWTRVAMPHDATILRLHGAAGQSLGLPVNAGCP